MYAIPMSRWLSFGGRKGACCTSNLEDRVGGGYVADETQETTS